MGSTRTKVVVVGGGYAGVLAANRLTQRDDLVVTLVNPRPTFVHRIRLHQLVAGGQTTTVDYAELLSDRVRLVVDAATRIDRSARTVDLASGATIGFDHLVYAVGSAGAAPTVPGAAAHALQVATLEDAQRARAVIERAPVDAPVTVVGAGATGLEVASELAAEGRTVTLVAGRVLNPYLHPRVRRRVEERLRRLGVIELQGPDATVTEVDPEAVHLGDGRTLPSAVTLWTAGFSLPDLAASSGLSTDADGRLRTDETLTSVDDESIVAAGDAASPSDLPLRMSMQGALPLGAHAADTVLRRIDGLDPRPFDIALFFQCISLGGGAATVQLASRQDVANRFAIGGRLGAKIKTDSYTQLIDTLAHEARQPGSYAWHFKGRKQRERLLARRDALRSMRSTEEFQGNRA